MNCSGDVASNWKVFREAYKDYAIATQLTEKAAAIQVATLKSVMGTEYKQVLKRLELTEKHLNSTETILAKLKEHFAPERNILYERYLFYNAEQQSNEMIDQYVLQLRRLAEPYKFEGFHDDMLRDRLVLGARDKSARARLFCEKECKLKKVVESLRISESTQEQLRLIGGAEEETVNVVNSKETRHSSRTA